MVAFLFEQCGQNTSLEQRRQKAYDVDFREARGVRVCHVARDEEREDSLS